MQRRFAVGYQSFRTAFRPHLQGSRQWKRYVVPKRRKPNTNFAAQRSRRAKTSKYTYLNVSTNTTTFWAATQCGLTKFWGYLLPQLQNARVAYLHGKYQSVQRHISKYRRTFTIMNVQISRVSTNLAFPFANARIVRLFYIN